MLCNSFSLKHLSMTTCKFQLIIARALQGYVCLRKKDTGYQKSVVKTLFNVFLLVKTEWQNV